MRVILQRVNSASVTVANEVVGQIGKGLLVLVGVSREDLPPDAEHLAKKILNLRLWDEEKAGSAPKPWAASVMQKSYSLLLVSQFTLYCVPKGNKPDFHNAMTPKDAEPFYDSFVEMVRKNYPGGTIATGKFGADMQVNLCNDGPVTISLDTDDLDFTKEYEKQLKAQAKWQKQPKKEASTDAAVASPPAESPSSSSVPAPSPTAGAESSPTPSASPVSAADAQ